jgi:hypothetical protein
MPKTIIPWGQTNQFSRNIDNATAQKAEISFKPRLLLLKRAGKI